MPLSLKMINRYSDRQLKEERQTLFLITGGFVIRLTFDPGEQLVFKKKLIEDVFSIWGEGGFLKKSAREYDFEIKFRPDASPIEVLTKGKGRYFLTAKTNFHLKTVETFYSIGLYNFQAILKDVLLHLIRKDGFLLHASSTMTKKRELMVFLSPSGGGKTTVADLLSSSSSQTKLTDDSLIVRKAGSDWMFFSTLFVEKSLLPRNKKTGSAKIFFIRKSKKASCQKITNKGEILKLLLPQVWLREATIDRATFNLITDFVNTMDNFYLLEAARDGASLARVIK
jgi:hypothetical protein